MSTTTIESFRLFVEQDEEHPWMAEDELLATIRGEGFVPTHEILLGRAFDAILGDPETHRTPGGNYQSGTFIFRPDVMEPALALVDPLGVVQVKGTKAYGDVVVVSKADQIAGVQIVENKATTSGFRLEKYADSLQWRFMLDVLGGAYVTYRVHELDEDRSGEILLREIHTVNYFPYLGLEADCRAWLDRFVTYVRARGLAPLLEQRQHEAEARDTFAF